MSVVRIGWVLIKLPFGVLRVLAMNMVNMVAPEMMFKLVQRMLEDKEEMAIARERAGTIPDPHSSIYIHIRIQIHINMTIQINIHTHTWTYT